MNNPARTRERMQREREIVEAASRGVRAALVRHKQAGVPVAVWRDGRVVLIPAEEALAAMDAADAADAADRAKTVEKRADRSTDAA